MQKISFSSYNVLDYVGNPNLRTVKGQEVTISQDMRGRFSIVITHKPEAWRLPFTASYHGLDDKAGSIG